VITSFKHKGLERFFTTGSKAGIQPQHAERLRLVLGRLNVCTSVRDMNLPGLDLHELRGDRKGTWSVKVSGNWRVTFTFVGKNVVDVNYEDYH
jgi:proteic killer suppression protein